MERLVDRLMVGSNVDEIDYSDVMITELGMAMQVRSGVGAYARAARRRVHLATTVFLRPPSGHRPGKRRARNAGANSRGSHEKSVVGSGKLGAPKNPAVLHKFPATAYEYIEYTAFAEN